MPTVIRPAWVPETEEQRVLLVKGQLKREDWRKSERETWKLVLQARELGIPDEVICKRWNLGKTTLNRYFGPRGSTKRPEWWDETDG